MQQQPPLNCCSPQQSETSYCSQSYSKKNCSSIASSSVAGSSVASSSSSGGSGSVDREVRNISGSSLFASGGIYMYEAKRAGGVYENMLRVLRAGNNSNTLPGIRDVQVHKSQSGQSTTVETQLQPSGATADLNISIIMDSDSNLSNALGHASIEYESLDQTGPSEDGPTSAATVAGADANEGSSEAEVPHERGADPAANGRYDPHSGFGGSSGGSIQTSDEFPEGQQTSSLASSREVGSGRADGGGGRTAGGGVNGGGRTDGGFANGGGVPSAADFQEDSDADPPQSTMSMATPLTPEVGLRDDNSDDDDSEEDADEDEEGGEGEEGDFDDAMRHFQRYVDGENVDALRGPANEEEAKETRRKLPVGHLEKEGVVIGCMSVFSDIHIKEFIVFLSDEMIQAFLVDPGRFRSVANRTKCEIEVTRRILNRRMGRYRWLKYLIVDIRGPSYSAIDQCDKMMISLFPPYRGRKPYGRPAVVSIFLKETTPDNTDLYYNFQRTGPSQRMFGEIPLRAPFRRTKNRPIESTPWKATLRRQQWGIIEPKNDRMETVMSHVYPERGGVLSGALDHSIKWAEAAEQAVVMSKAKDVAWAQALKARKVNSEPLFANVFGE